MKRLVGALIVVCSLVLANAVPVAAHDVVRYVYHSPVQYRAAVVRSNIAPSWLQRNESFRQWYRHSLLRKNRYLSWPELYQVFRWERSYRTRRYESSYADHSDDWYRRYWRSPHDTDSRNSDRRRLQDRDYRH